MNSLSELFTYSFMQSALTVGGIVSIVCSFIGVFVVLRGLSFLSAGISHSAFAGVAFGLLLGVSPLIAAIVFCSVVSICIGYVSKIGKLGEDTSIGIFFAGSMALGFAIMGLTSSPSVDIMGYLFGNILGLSPEYSVGALGAGAVIIGIVLYVYKELVMITFDEELAVLAGVPVTFLNYLLLVLMAIAVVLSMRVVGSVLSAALLVTPAATALQLSTDIRQVIVYSVAIGFVTTEVGLILAFLLDTGPGATVTLLSTAVFMIATFVRRARVFEMA